MSRAIQTRVVVVVVVIVALLMITCGLLKAVRPRAAWAQGTAPAPEANWLLRILAYDRNLKQRAGEQVTLALAYSDGDPASARACAELLREIQAIPGHEQVATMPLRVLVVPLLEVGSFAARLIQERVAAVFVCPGLSGRIGQISYIARRRHMLSISGNEEDLRGGVSIALRKRDDRHSVVINLPASRAEGADLDAALLRVAEVIQ